MVRKPDPLMRFWKDIELRVGIAARLIVASSNAVVMSDREDLAQDTLLDLHQFFERRTNEEPEMDLDALCGEVMAWGAICLRNNFYDLVRKNRRRAPRNKALGGSSTEAEGYLDFSVKRAFTPFERQVALEWIEKRRPRSKSPKVQSIFEALRTVVEEDLDALPKDVRLMAGVTANDMHHFRERIAGAGENGE